MGDEKKPTLNLDDWDSLPLDPGADDWDDEPEAAPKTPVQLEPAFPPPAGLKSASSVLPSTQKILIEEEPLEVEAFPAASAAGEAGPGQATAPRPRGAPADEADEADEAPFAADVQELLQNTGPVNLEEDDFGDPVLPFRPDAPASTVVPPPGPEKPASAAVVPPPGPERPASAAVVPPPGGEEAPNAKKVELDIEGIFLDSAAPAEPPPAEEPPAPASAPAPPEVPPAPKEPEVRKIAKTKMLILVVPAVVVLLGLIFGLYKLFFSGPPEAPLTPEKPLVIETRAPPREPTPGEIQLGPFYINFPGRRNDIMAEMFVVIYYEDAPDRFFIENELTVIRDIVYRVTQGLGAEVIADSQLQKRLRQELMEKANAALGAPRISFIQISQLRVLQ
jgi:flagellar basal body-associated protein FliL